MGSWRWRGWPAPRARRRALQAVYAWQLSNTAINKVIDQFRKQQVEQRYFVPLARIAGEDETEQEALDKLSADGGNAASPEMKAFQSQLGKILGVFLEELDDALVVEQDVAAPAACAHSSAH